MMTTRINYGAELSNPLRESLVLPCITLRQYLGSKFGFGAEGDIAIEPNNDCFVAKSGPSEFSNFLGKC
jgi:hypothetical protein